MAKPGALELLVAKIKEFDRYKQTIMCHPTRYGVMVQLVIDMGLASTVNVVSDKNCQEDMAYIYPTGLLEGL